MQQWGRRGGDSSGHTKGEGDSNDEIESGHLQELVAQATGEVETIQPGAPLQLDSHECQPGTLLRGCPPVICCQLRHLRPTSDLHPTSSPRLAMPPCHKIPLATAVKKMTSQHTCMKQQTKTRIECIVYCSCTAHLCTVPCELLCRLSQRSRIKQHMMS